MSPRWLGWVFAALRLMALLWIGDHDATVSPQVGAAIHLTGLAVFCAIDAVVSTSPLVLRNPDESSALVRAFVKAGGPPWLDLRGPPGAYGIPWVSDPAAGDAGRSTAKPRTFSPGIPRPEEAPREDRSFATAFS